MKSAEAACQQPLIRYTIDTESLNILLELK